MCASVPRALARVNTSAGTRCESTAASLTTSPLLLQPGDRGRLFGGSCPATVTGPPGSKSQNQLAVTHHECPPPLPQLSSNSCIPQCLTDNSISSSCSRVFLAKFFQEAHSDSQTANMQAIRISQVSDYPFKRNPNYHGTLKLLSGGSRWLYPNLDAVHERI